MRRLISITFVWMALTVAALAQSTIEVKWSGSKATVTIPAGITDVKATIDGANVSITSTTTSTEYTYRLSGTSSDGSLTLYGDYKLTLQLAGLSLTNAHGGAAIDVECGKRIAVVLAKGTRNTLADAAKGSQKATLYFKGHAEFEDHGVLNVTGNLKHAICAKEYMELKASTGTINIHGAVGDGLHCGKGKANNEHNYFMMKGGNVNIMNVGGDGIDSDDYGTVSIEGGAISINVADGATGLKADSVLTVRGGTVNIAVKGNDSEGLRSRYRTTISGGRIDVAVTGNGSKGIKGKRYTEEATVLNGGDVTISGGEVNIHVLGGNLKDPVTDNISKCMGLSVDADYQQIGGTVNITAIGPDTYTYSVKGDENRDGGTLNAVSAPWTLNPADYQYDMSAYVVVKKSGTAFTDYTGKAVGAFVGTQCVGYAVFPEDAGYGILRIYSNSTTGNSKIVFRLHENNNDFKLSPSSDVSFTNQAIAGSPDNPLILSCANYPLGDVNRVNGVDKEDVEYYAGYIVGKNKVSVSSAQADIDGDGKCNIADLTRLIKILLQRQEAQGM